MTILIFFDFWHYCNRRLPITMISCISSTAGRPAGRTSRSAKIENFENCHLTFLDVKMSRRDGFVMQNCTDTLFEGTSSSKKQPIWWKIEIFGMSRYVTLGHAGSLWQAPETQKWYQKSYFLCSKKYYFGIKISLRDEFYVQNCTYPPIFRFRSVKTTFFAKS